MMGGVPWAARLRLPGSDYDASRRCGLRNPENRLSDAPLAGAVNLPLGPPRSSPILLTSHPHSLSSVQL
jgi:hypothetical protein